MAFELTISNTEVIATTADSAIIILIVVNPKYTILKLIFILF